jgi:hypothetical protein
VRAATRRPAARVGTVEGSQGGAWRFARYRGSRARFSCLAALIVLQLGLPNRTSISENSSIQMLPPPSPAGARRDPWHSLVHPGPKSPHRPSLTNDNKGFPRVLHCTPYSSSAERPFLQRERPRLSAMDSRAGPCSSEKNTTYSDSALPRLVAKGARLRGCPSCVVGPKSGEFSYLAL